MPACWLVFGVGVVDHHAQRRQTAVAGQLARLLVLAQQQPQRAARQRAAPEVAVDRPANAAAAVGLVGASDGGAGGFQKVVEEAGEVVHGGVDRGSNEKEEWLEMRAFGVMSTAEKIEL